MIYTIKHLEFENFVVSGPAAWAGVCEAGEAQDGERAHQTGTGATFIIPLN